jgi:hypothetical protein
VSQSCNPSYSRSRDQEVKIKRIAVWGQSGQKDCETPSQPIKAGCGGTHLHPSYAGSVNRKDVVQASLEITHKVRPYLKNNQSKKGCGVKLKWQSFCLANVRSWVQHPIPPKKF